MASAAASAGVVSVISPPFVCSACMVIPSASTVCFLGWAFPAPLLCQKRRFPVTSVLQVPVSLGHADWAFSVCRKGSSMFTESGFTHPISPTVLTVGVYGRDPCQPWRLRHRII